jgi:hypothetical protein
MTTKLKLYNRALSHLSTVRLNSLTEDRKERYELDAVYDEVLQECLELGNWKHAKRSSMLEYDDSIEPTFGYPNAFAKPDDYVRLIGLAEDENFKVEVSDWVDEGGTWYSNLTVMYVSYVSNDTSYGLNLAIYPENYAHFVGTRLALRSSLPISRDKFTRNDLISLSKDALGVSKRLDAINEPVKQKPPGRLTTSRVGNSRRPYFRGGKISF